MATASVHTPLKSHAGIFSMKTAGGRMPLSPSPRNRSNSTSNRSPFTPPPKNMGASRKDLGTSIYAGGLTSHFSAVANGSAKKPTFKNSPKSNITRSSFTPVKLGVSDWALTGTGPNADKLNNNNNNNNNTNVAIKHASPIKKVRKGKTTIRAHSSHIDRFVPNRTASSPTGITKANFKRQTGPRGHTDPDSIFNSLSDEFSATTLSTYNGNADCDSPSSKPKMSPNSAAYQSALGSAVGIQTDSRVLAFKPAAPESSRPIDLRSQYNRPLKAASNAQFRRRVLTAPERVLDAPGLVDDYYLNLMDWGSSNMVAIGLERNVYIWNASTGSVSSLLESSPDTNITSVKWSNDGSFVAVGLGTGEVQIWDPEENSKVRSMHSHSSRVGVMSWDKHILSTGSRSGEIINHDVRIADHKVASLVSHTAEVCGLEWRADGAQLASGGNDNLVNIWDARALSAPRFSKTNHKAAVKAIAWCPWQNNLLATGGGTFDKKIHFWNSTTGARVNTIDCNTQVTSLKWSTSYKEIVSTHGFPDNQLIVWSYPSLVKCAEIPAHETRVLHSALSPDGQVLATAASDESLKFWKIFEKKAGAAGLASVSAMSTTGKGGDISKQMTIR
ncbi:ubiquitin-protein transferase activating protein [Orbilia oligospora]|uniref:Ubiquitin-protein transferase activating protein n=1 Tax=Orbilia oligospora TaxID=2813651 RepID=A0A7C8NG82_ORBOL|nr:ubiquitin-protein transferase activating protein [Orbilia oligospora]KAF3083743.1 ubiquitin-protein transferase activating protein [Orbilia oligospora]KAF3095580.1 ubiquitin-protein transferase activating protein [Orbilia oligospora]KAF3125205.1 ubiquitin-protein transferase activating protein [Orbilia oligospora]KAF3154150.1 ubiquitin-protein transferase activating protein [Orbilia oligospora]